MTVIKQDLKTEALKLALEALEYIHEGANNQGPHTGISWRCVSNKAEPAITAIREALADSALDRMAENARDLGLDYEPPCKTGSQCTSKCQHCDEPHEQPHCNDCGGFDPECPLAQPAQQQEPVAWRTKNATPPGGYVVFQQYPQAVAELGGEIEPLYTSSPASKPWVGLTHDEWDELQNQCEEMVSHNFRFAVLAKLREKNA